MPNLFGLNIASILNDALNSAGGLRPAVLTKSVNGTRTPGSLTAGNNPTTTTHNCQAYVERSTERVAGTLVETGGMVVGIIGASIAPSAEPEPSDIVTVDGVDYTIDEISEVDPARALFICSVQS